MDVWTCPKCNKTVVGSIAPEQLHVCPPQYRRGSPSVFSRETAIMAKRREQLLAARAAGGLPEVTTRHLLYHVYPSKRNDLWLDNVWRLQQHWHLFNGKRVIAVATSGATHSFERVQQEFDGFGALLVPFANDPELREVATFTPLLAHCQGMGESDAVFYGHTKGNATADNEQGALIWKNIGYDYLLGKYYDFVRPALGRAAAVGIHKMIWPSTSPSPYPTRLVRGDWMFAGTFFWFRPSFTHSCDDWRKVPVDRYGAEAWLAGLLPKDIVESVYQIWDESVWPCPCPYLPGIYPLEDQQKYGSAILSRPK